MTMTNMDRPLLRRIARRVRWQVILGDVWMVFVCVEVDRVVAHPVALTGLVVDP